MRKGWQCFLLLILLNGFHPSFCLAQDADTTTLEELAAEDKPNYFNAVTEEASIPVAVRKVPPAKRDSLRNDPAFWYADYEPEVERPAGYKPSALLRLLSASWFRTLLWTIVIGGFVAILIWFLRANDVRLYRKKEKPVGAATEDIHENIFAINYEVEIAAAIAAGDYRQAVRLHYLQLLRHLSDTGVIQYRQERTNTVYRQQLYGTEIYLPFTRLTRHFEFVWYGKFPLSREAFDRIHQDYLHFKKGAAA
jgi:hypothetical protein